MIFIYIKRTMNHKLNVGGFKRNRSKSYRNM